MSSQPGIRILVVDDNTMNVELVNAVLMADGLQLESAINAAEALEKVASFKPTLILMDIQLPGMNGLELTRRLKADPLTRGICIVAFTALAMKGDETRLLAGGCDGYLSKPFDISTLAATVRAYASAGLQPSLGI